LKIDISPYLSKKPSDFLEILYTAADFELDKCHVIKNEKVALDRLRVRQERISCSLKHSVENVNITTKINLQFRNFRNVKLLKYRASVESLEITTTHQR